MTLAASLLLRTPHKAAAVYLAAAFFVCLEACSEPPKRHRLSGATMGTTWSVVYGDPQRVDAEALQARIERELVEINAALSTYLPDSEISVLNAHPGDVSHTPSTAFKEVLLAAQQIAEQTSGAYDVTVGPLVDLWGFGAPSVGDRVPTPEEVSSALQRIGSDKLRLQNDILTRDADVRVDFSSIAKGFAVDRVSAILVDEGLSNTLAEIGGELRATGSRPEGGPWMLAVESPDPSQGRFIEAIAARNIAVATSGDYRNYFEVDGKRYSHLVDPRTGYPVEHQLVSVTVLHAQCMWADAYATALIVLGKDAALTLAKELNLAVLTVSRVGTELEVHYSPAFESYLVDS